MGLGVGIIGLSDYDYIMLVGVRPGSAPHYHLPPYTHIFGRVDPAHVFQGARLVEVKYQPGSQHFAGVVHHHYGAPGSVASGLKESPPAFGIGSKMSAEGPAPELQVCSGIIYHCGLVDVDIQPVVRLQLKGGLHSGGAEGLLGGIPHPHLLCRTADFAHPGDVVAVFLGVVIPGNPECGMVLGHRELGELVLDHEIDQVRLLGEFVAEAQAVVVETEAHYHRDAVLFEGDGHLVVVVADDGFLSPHRLPGFVETGCLHILQGEAALHVHRLAVALALVPGGFGDIDLFSPESEAELAGLHHLPPVVLQFVGGNALFVHIEIQLELSARAEQSASRQ